MNKSEIIRKVVIEKGVAARNSEIQQYCVDNFGFEPSHSLIYRVIGNQKERMLSSINGKQLCDLKQVCKSSFDGDYQLLIEGAIALKNTDIVL